MADSAALLVDEVLPHQPMRQWVLGNCSRHGSTSHIHVVVSVPFPLRFLFARNPIVLTGCSYQVFSQIVRNLGAQSKWREPLLMAEAV